MDTIESNKLIAEFMGFTNTTPTDPDFSIYENSEGHLIDMVSAKYDESFDWLMPVMEKISSLDDFTSERIWRNMLKEMDVFTAFMWNDISVVYKAVVEFIDWYNKQK